MLRVAAGKDMERGIKKEGLSSHNEVTQNANLPLVWLTWCACSIKGCSFTQLSSTEH